MSQDSIMLISILVNIEHQWHTDRAYTWLMKAYCTSYNASRNVLQWRLPKMYWWVSIRASLLLSVALLLQA